MRRWVGWIAIAGLSVGWAQAPKEPEEKPPAGVEEALRARVEEFYHYFVTQEFRKAEKLVAEDSQDYYYNQNKPHFASAELQKITFSDHFTHAQVTVLCGEFFFFPGFTGKPIKMPALSTWKLVDGQWFWYVDQTADIHTPFGVFHRQPNTPPPPAGALPSNAPTSPDFLMQLVKADKGDVTLKDGEDGIVTITNGAPGAVSLEVERSPVGIEAKLDHAQLAAGEKAVLTVHAGEGARAGRLLLRVHPTQEAIPLEIRLP